MSNVSTIRMYDKSLLKMLLRYFGVNYTTQPPKRTVRPKTSLNSVKIKSHAILHGYNNRL